MPAELAQKASPDALLALGKKAGRGRLKIFLGAAPGVGKTYAMLTAARAEKDHGREVVLGLVETHGRRETEALVEGLEAIPRKPTIYVNKILSEFDLDKALARKPRLLLVDELAPIGKEFMRRLVPGGRAGCDVGESGVHNFTRRCARAGPEGRGRRAFRDSNRSNIGSLPRRAWRPG